MCKPKKPKIPKPVQPPPLPDEELASASRLGIRREASSANSGVRGLVVRRK